MKRIAVVILLLSTTAAPATILCQDAAGRELVHWWWRDIDGSQKSLAMLTARTSGAPHNLIIFRAVA